MPDESTATTSDPETVEALNGPQEPRTPLPRRETRNSTRSRRSGAHSPQNEAATADASPRPRTNTPDRVNPDGSTTIKLKRCCNGCGQYVGDLDDRDINDHGGLTDVRHECPNCRILVELEAAGCRTWRVTERSISRVAHEIDQLRPWVFTKGYWQEVDGKLQVVGLRVGQYPDHAVAFYGDWLIRQPDGTWTVHKAPEAVTA
jgi:hypothetical protein